jgi:hypothetical protein
MHLDGLLAEKIQSSRQRCFEKRSERQVYASRPSCLLPPGVLFKTIDCARPSDNERSHHAKAWSCWAFRAF